MHEAELAALFRPFGAVQSVSIVRDGMGVSRGFGYLEPAEPASCRAMVQGVHGRRAGGSSGAVLSVRVADGSMEMGSSGGRPAPARDTQRRARASKDSRRRGTHFGMYSPEEAAAREQARKGGRRQAPGRQGARDARVSPRDRTDTALALLAAPASSPGETEIVLSLGEHQSAEEASGRARARSSSTGSQDRDRDRDRGRGERDPSKQLDRAAVAPLARADSAFSAGLRGGASTNTRMITAVSEKQLGRSAQAAVGTSSGAYSPRSHRSAGSSGEGPPTDRPKPQRRLSKQRLVQLAEPKSPRQGRSPLSSRSASPEPGEGQGHGGLQRAGSRFSFDAADVADGVGGGEFESQGQQVARWSGGLRAEGARPLPSPSARGGNGVRASPPPRGGQGRSPQGGGGGGSSRVVGSRPARAVPQSFRTAGHSGREDYFGLYGNGGGNGGGSGGQR